MLKNHKKKANKNYSFKKWDVKWTKGKRTQFMILKKDNLQIV